LDAGSAACCGYELAAGDTPLIDLGFLWLAFFVLGIVAFFAILITGRYPEPTSTSTRAC
jgi:hypothetical protein